VGDVAQWESSRINGYASY